MVDVNRELLSEVDRSTSLASLSILTGITAVFPPQPDDSIEQVSERDLSNIIGLNKRAKYFSAGIKHRAGFNFFLGMLGEIEIGEEVVFYGM